VYASSDRPVGLGPPERHPWQPVEDLRIGKRREMEQGIDVGNARTGVENETVVALAEVMDIYAYATGTELHGVEKWEKEFQLAGQGTFF